LNELETDKRFVWLNSALPLLLLNSIHFARLSFQVEASLESAMHLGQGWDVSAAG
jgi:hypothetical protein